MTKWQGQRDFWLDHYYQYPPGKSRPAGRIRESDYMGAPFTQNMPTPLAQPCLIWRWTLATSGYGEIDGRGTHIIAFEQSRGTSVSPKDGDQVNHLCHRRFCIQPAHLYLGNAKTNSEDRRALASEIPSYKTWKQVGDRFDKAMTEHYWPAPQIEAYSPPLMGTKPIDCPHDFDTIRSAGSADICLNCGELGGNSRAKGHRTSCQERWPQASKCRCEPCCCRRCLTNMLVTAQRKFEETGGWPTYNLGGKLPESFFDEETPLSRETAKEIRVVLEKWTQHSTQF